MLCGCVLNKYVRVTHHYFRVMQYNFVEIYGTIFCVQISVSMSTSPLAESERTLVFLDTVQKTVGQIDIDADGMRPLIYYNSISFFCLLGGLNITAYLYFYLLKRT